jgi:integrase
VPKVRYPRLPTGRERRLEGDEEARLLDALSQNLIMHAAVRFALETAMRRGELAAMKWRDVDLHRCLLIIPETKTGTPRTIPLSSRAMNVLRELRAHPTSIDGVVFTRRPPYFTERFAAARKRAGIEDLRFHDLRHEAVSRLFERGLNVMEVATISGHQDLRMLNRYTHLRPEDLLKKLG